MTEVLTALREKETELQTRVDNIIGAPELTKDMREELPSLSIYLHSVQNTIALFVEEA